MKKKNLKNLATILPHQVKNYMNTRNLTVQKIQN